MNNTTRGLILEVDSYRENDRKLCVLTKDYGKLTLVAKGAGKVSSKLGGSLLPFIEGEFLFDYRDNKTMFTLRTMHVVTFHEQLYKDIECQCVASIVSEITKVIANASMHPNSYEEVYDHLAMCYAYIATKKDYNLAGALYLSYILKIQGITPSVDCCSKCLETKAYRLSIEDGGFVCSKCSGMQANDDMQFLKEFRYVVKGDLMQFDEIKPHITTSYDILCKLIAFFEYHVGIKIHSYAFYHQLCSIE